MLNKNLVYQTPSHEQLHAENNPDTSKIMEKIYGSTVFQEFMKQWGEAANRIEHKNSQDSKQQ
ncbi:MAG: hypothetical protein AB1728_07470 [Bacteroidota bacterium]